MEVAAVFERGQSVGAMHSLGSLTEAEFRAYSICFSEPFGVNVVREKEYGASVLAFPPPRSLQTGRLRPLPVALVQRSRTATARLRTAVAT